MANERDKKRTVWVNAPNNPNHAIRATSPPSRLTSALTMPSNRPKTLNTGQTGVKSGISPSTTQIASNSVVEKRVPSISSLSQSPKSLIPTTSSIRSSSISKPLVTTPHSSIRSNQPETSEIDNKQHSTTVNSISISSRSRPEPPVISSLSSRSVSRPISLSGMSGRNNITYPENGEMSLREKIMGGDIIDSPLTVSDL